MGDIAPTLFPKGESGFHYMTLDYSLDDDIKITRERIEIGINATVFNSNKGYRTPDVPAPISMPIHDPKIRSML